MWMVFVDPGPASAGPFFLSTSIRENFCFLFVCELTGKFRARHIKNIISKFKYAAKSYLSCMLFHLMAIASTNCFAQQYPFVHYSPKDGLVSNRVRSIYQDGKGLMYFLTMNGLSVYDGTRFINY